MTILYQLFHWTEKAVTKNLFPAPRAISGEGGDMKENTSTAIFAVVLWSLAYYLGVNGYVGWAIFMGTIAGGIIGVGPLDERMKARFSGR